MHGNSGLSHLAPIGVFDSGVGGLSVLREIRRALPHEDLIYVADSGHAPYGDRDSDFIETRSVAIVDFLLARGAKAIVIACNTATAAAVATLRARYRMPIVAMEPAVKPAAANTRSGVVGVLATRGTVESAAFAQLIERFGADAKVLAQACPGLVERVEAGDPSGPESRALVERYVRPLVEQGADTLVLGCTHYPFLAPLIAEIAGPDVAIIDPAAAVARELKRRLETASLLSPATHRGEETFWTSAAVDQARAVFAGLWQADVEIRRLPD